MESIREVYSLLVPIENGRIILPRAAVAEVTGFVRPKDRPDNAPDFLMGFIEWQKQRIPLIAFEAACGRPVPETGRRARIAVVFGTEGRLQNPNAFAIVTQGYPYLVRVNEGVLLPEEMEEGDEDAPVLARARMANERPKIPDISRLENMTADALGLPAAPVEEDIEVAEEIDELDALAAGEEESEDGLIEEDSVEEASPGDSYDAEESEKEEYDLDDIEFDTDDDDSSDEPGDLDDLLNDDED